MELGMVCGTNIEGKLLYQMIIENVPKNGFI